MNKSIKKIITLILVIISTVSITLISNNLIQTNKPNKQQSKTVSIIATFTESRNDFHLENGDTAIELSDNSFAIYNETTNLYSFTPASMGDWDYKLNNKTELDNIIATYISIANNGTY